MAVITKEEREAFEKLKAFVAAASELNEAWEKIGPFDVLTEQLPDGFVDFDEQLEDFVRWRDDVEKVIKKAGGNDLAVKIGDAFAGILGGWLTAEEMGYVRVRNLRFAEADVCASHDVCDANMAMDEAFVKVLGRHSDVGSSADATLWGEAWDYAKRAHLTARKG